jgi:hypothetical protein
MANLTPHLCPSVHQNSKGVRPPPLMLTDKEILLPIPPHLNYAVLPCQPSDGWLWNPAWIGVFLQMICFPW